MSARVVFALSALAFAAGCKSCDEPAEGSGDASARALTPLDPKPVPPAPAQSGRSKRFADFKPPAVDSKGRLGTSTIAADLSNVEIASLLTPEQRAKIAEAGFVVSPGAIKEFYELYERARYEYVPIFVTSDSLLHIYHLLFDKTLRRVEAARLAPRLEDLDNALLLHASQSATALAEGPWADAARRTAAYFAVAKRLLKPDSALPELVREAAELDLARIEKHAGPAPSAIFPEYSNGEDWSQYAPRGHYTKTETLQRYFRAMTWHGRMTFRAGELEETKSAALLMFALDRATVGGRPAREVWAEIYEPTVFFVGKSDDLSPLEYETAYRAAFGTPSTAADVADESKLAKFRAALVKLRAPEILGMVIDRDDPDAETATKGLRFMGQRFVPDSFVFRRLVDRNVPDRMLPKALDFFAALGSERALELASEGEGEKYRENMEELIETFRGYGADVFTQNLYWTWIHGLRPLLEPVPDGYPLFMRSPAWIDKQLTTALGSWTELKHDTLLYSKPVYAEMGSGGLPPPEPVPPKGYVEPVPEVFARIVGLSEMTRAGLDRRGLLDDKDRRALGLLEELAKKLAVMAEKELRGVALSKEEYEAIRFYGGKIEELTFASTDEIDVESGGMPEGGDALQVAIVADVATDPNGRVLEEAVGRVFTIHAVVPIEGKMVLAEGGVFSHYEFVVPIGERLTDEAWRKRLDEGRAPPLAPWTKSFVVEQIVPQAAADRIRAFTEHMIQSLWYTSSDGFAQYLEGEALAAMQKWVGELKPKREFVGRERLSIEFLSFDFRGDGGATVTTRERWKDQLNRGDPVEEELEKLSERGPYETVVTYTLRLRERRWMIETIVHRPELPAWKK